MAKTPVSMLQEYCARRVTVPQYDLVVNGVGTHEPYFQYRLTVIDVVTVGEGKSKKEAKHEAARKAISILIPQSKEVKQENSTSSSSGLLEEQRDLFFSPYQDVVKQNFVGELATVSASKALPEPKYVFVGEVGLPHAKTFTFECHVGNIKECASSRTKQQAKHLSAFNMMNRLKNVIGPTILEPEEPPDKIIDNLSKKAKSIITTRGTKRIGEPLRNFVKNCQYFDAYTFFDNSPFLRDLSVYSDDIHKNSENACDLLEKLFESCGKTVVYSDIPTKHDFHCSCQMNSAPYFVTIGYSDIKSVAQLKAAHRLLLILKSFVLSVPSL